MKDTIKEILILAICFALGFWLSRFVGRQPTEPEVITVTDTITKIDTLLIDKPVPVKTYIHDTIRTYFTTIEHDTVLVDVPIERKVYAEDSVYYASVSGWHPSLDTLIVYPKETTITITNTVNTPAPKWSFGATVGPSVIVSPSGRVGAGLGVTAGLSYRF